MSEFFPMQVACPKCGQTLKIGAVSAPKVAITCPKCSHAFQVTLPSSAPATPPAAFDSPFDSLPPTPTSNSATFRQAAPKKAKPKPINWKPIVTTGVAVAVGLAIIGLGLFAFSKRNDLAQMAGIADGDADGQDASSDESFLGSLVPRMFRSDTPQIIFDEYFELQDRMLLAQTSLKRYDENDRADLLEQITEANGECRDLLRRALALPPCPIEEQEKFKKRSEVFGEKSKLALKKHFDSLTETKLEKAKKGLLGREVSKEIPFVVVITGFLSKGIYAIEEQEAAQSKIYAREVEVMRRLNRFLAETEADGVSSGDAETLEAFADELIELATERSTAEGGGYFVDRALGDAGEAHRAMTTIYVMRINQVADPVKSFVDAADIFRASQRFFDRVKGSSPDEIRKEFAAAKQLIKQPDQVAKKTNQPTPPKQTPSKPPEQHAKPIEKAKPDVADVAKAEQEAGSAPDKANAEPSHSAERPRGFGGVPRGPFGAGPFGPGAGGRRGGAMRGGRGPSFESPGSAPRGPRQGGGFGPQSIRTPEQSRASLESRMERFKGSGGATILFDQAKDTNLAETAKVWANELGVSDYMVQSSSGKAQLHLRWSGSIDSLSKKIKFARVIETDEKTRQIRVEVAR